MNRRAIPHARIRSVGARLRLLLVGLALLVGGCAESGVTAQRPAPAEDEAVRQDYIGLSESQARDLARSRDIPFRVVTRDGLGQMVTFDFVRGRINADIRDGVVVAYAVEGAKQRTPNVPSAVKTPN